MKNNVSTNLIFLFFVIISIVAIPLFNFTVDPYNVFFRKNFIMKLYDDRNMRDSVYPIMKYEQKNDYDYVLLGSSNANASINPQDFRQNTGKKLYKLTLDGATLPESFELIKAYKSFHNNKFKVLVALDFCVFLENQSNVLPKFSGKNLNSEEWFKLLFAKSTTKYSYYTFRDLFLKDFLTEFFINLSKYPLFENFQFAKSYSPCYITHLIKPHKRLYDIQDKNLVNANFTTIKEMKNYFEDNNIEYVFFVNSLHAYSLVNFHES